MTDETLTKIIQEQVRAIRARWDGLGMLETDSGAFATGHTPSVGPEAYLCRFYAGLSEDGLADAEAESERYLPPAYREFLKSYNGAHIMGISLKGLTGGQNLRDVGHTIGQPVSIRYQNAFYLRKDFIPEGHFGLGTMNGEWYAQGHLFLTSSGEVELINSEFDLTAATWPSLAEFIRQEVPRQLSRYDETGAELQGINRLPGNTDNWEALAKEVTDNRRGEASLLKKMTKKFRGLRKS